MVMLDSITSGFPQDIVLTVSYTQRNQVDWHFEYIHYLVLKLVETIYILAQRAWDHTLARSSFLFLNHSKAFEIYS